MAQHIIHIPTTGPGLYDMTQEVAAFVKNATRTSLARDGLLTVFVAHTSCSVIIQENADRRVADDLSAFFRKLVPPTSEPAMMWVSHNDEGPDDMPAHIKAALTQTSIGIPVSGGKMMLGTWQGIYLFEHRDKPHQRQVVLHLGA